MKDEAPLRILIIEDVPSDAELAERELRNDGIQFTSVRVDTQEGFLKALEEFQPHLILSDYAMPEFDGLQALRLSLKHDAKLPFIILTGSMNEETAVACMKAGATDYVLKDHLARLPFAVREALENKKFLLEKEAAEQALLKSEELYRYLFENANEAIYVAQDGKLVFLNPMTAMITGYSGEELMAIPFIEFIHPDDRDMVVDRHVRRIKGEELLYLYSFRIIHKEGSVRWVELNTILIKWNEKAATLNFLSDITERKQAEMALRESENRYRDLVENSQDLICTHDLEGNLLSVNDAPVRALGYSREFLLIVNPRDLLSPEQREKFGVYLKEIQEKGRASGILRLQTASGETRYWEYNNTLRTEGLAVPIVQGMAHDITERMKVELALRESEGRYRSHFENVSDVIFSYDREFRITSVSPSLERTLGYKPEEFIGKSFAELNILPPEYLEKALSDAMRVFNGEHLDSIIYKLIARDRTIKFGEFSSTPLIREGQVVAVVSVGRDITERKRVEEKLSESEKRYRDLYNFLPIPVYEMDLETNITSANRAIYETFRGTEEDLIKGIKAWQLLSPEEIQKSNRNIQRLLEGKQIEGTEYTLRRLDGSPFPAIVISSVIYSNDQPVGLRGAIVDITERKQAEEKLRMSEEKYRLIADNSNDWIYLINPDGKFQYVSPSCERLTGYSSLEFINNPELFLDIIHPDDKERVKFHLELAQKETEPHTLKFRIITKENEFCWINHSCLPVFNEQGQYMGRSGTNRDITERKRAEEALQESEEKYRNIFENALEGIYQATPDGLFLTANPALARMCGYNSPDELINSVNDLAGQIYVNPEQRKEFIRLLEEKGEIKGFEVQLKRKDGTPFWISNDGRAVRDSTGKTLYYEGISEDITQRLESDRKIKETLENLRMALGGIIQVISATVETRDPYTAGHQRRTTNLARAIAGEMNLNDNQRDGLRMAGIIHDLGKIAVPVEILSKPTKLTEIETKLIRVHPQVGHDILKNIDFPWPIAEIILQHHERINGSGYPQGLKGVEISTEARILMVADVVESMASYRPYRPALGVEAALEEIEKNKGILYDSQVVEVCLGLFREKGFSFE